jgi:hypothetical protein
MMVVIDRHLPDLVGLHVVFSTQDLMCAATTDLPTGSGAGLAFVGRCTAGIPAGSLASQAGSVQPVCALSLQLPDAQ